MRNLVPLLIVLWVVISFIAAIVRSLKAKEEAPDASETEEQKRMREIQDRIRRKIAERRGGAAPVAPAAPPPLVEPEAPRPRPTMLAPPPVHEDPVGDLLRRLVAEPARPAPAPLAPPPVDAAELERQAQLAAQMRELEAARHAAEKRAAQLAAEPSAAAAALVPANTQAAWLGDLRNAGSLRRAILLREILGPPVALR